MRTRTLVITGMHRSATSLVASTMQRAGVHIGEHLLGPAAGNPRGHFEDVDFCALHERALARQGLGFLLESSADLRGFDADERAEAERLIRMRESRPFWGWKDPRTSLFLPDWDRLLPEARYLFLYRHPIEVVLSLLRRATDLQIAADPLRGLRVWEVYNRAILDFARAHPDRCLLAHVSTLRRDSDAFVTFVARRLDLPLTPSTPTTSTPYVASELKSVPLSPAAEALFADLAPSTTALYADLNATAERGPEGASLAEATPSGLAALQAARARGRESGAVFVLLLAALDAEAVLASRDALDASRLASVADLDGAVRARDARIGELEAEAAGSTARLQEMADDVRALQHAVTSRTAELRTVAERLAPYETSGVHQLIRKWHGLAGRMRAAAAAPRANTADRAPVETSPPDPSPTVLFISHDAHRHGAQLWLLHLLRWIKADGRLRFAILLKNDGELRPDFEALGSTGVWPAVPWAATNGHAPNVALVYSNTITNGDVLAALADFDCPVVSHVHELEHWIHHHVDPAHLRQVVRRTSHYVAASEAVRATLVERLHVPSERIDLVYECIGPDALATPDATVVGRLRRDLGIPDDAMVVGGSGTIDWRKAPDLFVQLAAMVHRSDPSLPVHFLWVGGARTGDAFAKLWHDVVYAGLADRTHFVGAVTNPMDYFALFDVFALVSREDPFPLVALEAAAHGAPVVCFTGAGGMPEFVQDDCGFAVPYLDIDAMARRVLELLRSRERRLALGGRAAAKVRARHTVDVVGPRLLAIMERLMATRAERSAAH